MLWLNLYVMIGDYSVQLNYYKRYVIEVVIHEQTKLSMGFNPKPNPNLGAATEKDLSPQVRFEVGSFRSDMLLERKLREGV